MRPLPAAGAALAVLVLLWLGLRRLERAMIFLPTREVPAHPGVVGLKWEPVRLTASDGVALSAWWLPGPKDDSPVLLCLHGNGGNLAARLDKMTLLHGAGAAQLWVDWRGYGQSAGSPSEAGLYRDGLAAWAWINAIKQVPPERLVLYGESLGGGVAVELAARVGAAGLILDSAFTSVPDMAARVLPLFPRALIKTRFDNKAKLPRVGAPLLVLHSPDDDVVPFAMAQDNLSVHPGPKRLVELKGSHNEGFLESSRAFENAIRTFILEIAARDMR